MFKKTKIAIIGGGASGFFTAINIAEQITTSEITIYEGSNKLLSKVLISGGGRCNVTNKIYEPIQLSKNYPRGSDFLIDAFEQFNSLNTQEWFKERGVGLKTEEDGRVFPISNTSRSIYECLYNAAIKNNVKIKTNFRLTDLKRTAFHWDLKFKDEIISADYVVLCTGCNSGIFKILENNKISIIPNVPSLFTFNANNHRIKHLSGISIKNASVTVKENNQEAQNGPLLITHAGFSGPSILKLSAWNAVSLASLNYKFTLEINWLPDILVQDLEAKFKLFTQTKPKEKVLSFKDHHLPKRLWQELFELANLHPYCNWSEIGKKGIARLINSLCHLRVRIDGKSTFKEEFVTAGGIDLNYVNKPSFGIRGHSNLYAAGELLNIDAITGGFNFQAAWTGGFLVAKDILLKIKSKK